MRLNDKMTMREALPIFYEDYGLEEKGGIDLPYVAIKVFKGFHVYLPNPEARKAVLHAHDMHHMLTGYPTRWKGELEISAWEIATGCRHNWVALTLNYFGMLGGMFLNTKNVWKAYLRGKQTRNLYHSGYTQEELLDKTIGELKEELGLNGYRVKKVNNLSTMAKFAGNFLLGFVAIPAMAVVIPFFILYNIYVGLAEKVQIQA